MSYSFVVGGVRSGKSSLAVELATRAKAAVTFVATAQPLDDDMADRIGRHRAERPSAWATIEEPLRLAEAIASIPAAHFLVVDCLTVWTSNLMFAGFADADIFEYADVTAAALADRSGDGVVVSNEVGMGVHPSTELGRHYRDVLGGVNVRVARHASRAALVVAGRLLPLATADSWAR